MSNYYVEILQQGGDLFPMARIVGSPTGKTRIKADGTIEAEFFCIRKADNCETVWASKNEILTT